MHKIDFPTYITSAFSSFKPPDRLTVTEWAERYRYLSGLDSAFPGLWHTERTPYLRTPMDSFNDKSIKDITFCAGTQLGKTVMEQNMIGYAIMQEPSPMLIVYPTDKLAEFTSENRLQPMFRLSPALADKFDENGSQKLELHFTDMYIALCGANSPANLASRPARFVFFDEIDKFPKWTGDEASPIALAEERTKTFWDRKIVKVSSPTLESGNIWQSWLTADAQFKFFVPCPHCGEFQMLKFPQIKWDNEQSIQHIKYNAHYECEACGNKIDDAHKMEILRRGKWQRVNEATGKVHSVAFHLNSLYSPWLTWGDIAAKFLTSKDAPEELMNFVNSWLAEPWVSRASKMRSDAVMEKQLNYERATIPKAAQLLTMGVDVQLDHFWWTIRAWGVGLTSWLVDYGRAETWTDIEKFMRFEYPKENGTTMSVNLACVDSGYNVDDVYHFCTLNADKAVPTKGASAKLTARYKIANIDRATGFGLKLFIFDPSQFKDFIQGRLNIPAGDKGSWNIFKDTERLYCDQICAEQKVEHKDKKGRITLEWEKISSHAQNHLLDCETNAALAAEILGVRYLTDTPEQAEQEETETLHDDWLGNTSGWLQNIKSVI